MDKKQAINILIDGAKMYKEDFVNKNMLIIFLRTLIPIHISKPFFLPRHFLHLTGIEIKKERSSSYFYQKCLNKRLSPSEFDFKKDGTTELKLSVLLRMMKISNFSHMIGDYNKSKTNLVTDKISGTTSICMGFVKENAFYVPNTALKKILGI
jgi:hypothetical protein